MEYVIFPNFYVYDKLLKLKPLPHSKLITVKPPQGICQRSPNSSLLPSLSFTNICFHSSCLSPNLTLSRSFSCLVLSDKTSRTCLPTSSHTVTKTDTMSSSDSFLGTLFISDFKLTVVLSFKIYTHCR